MDVQGKVWGTTSLLFLQNNVEVHRIVGKALGFSSKHHHQSKFNMFFVERGSLLIRRWKGYGLVDQTYLGPQQSCVIPPGEPHQFEVVEEGTVAYEFYWTQLREDDIVREGHGGVHGQQQI